MRPSLAKSTATALFACLLASCGGSNDSGGPPPPSVPAPGGIGAWSTFQGNAGHTGFVDTDFDPAAFTKAWSWSRPSGDSEPIGGINSVAAGGGKVFVTKDI